MTTATPMRSGQREACEFMIGWASQQGFKATELIRRRL
jgi:hypothetical protein